MSFIAVDLKVIEGLAGQVARAASVPEDRILAGLVRLWHRCWATSTEYVTRAQLAGVIGGDRLEEVTGALVELGFLESGDDSWRVRGAARYLRLKEARRAGAEKTNAARSRAKAERRSRASTSDAQATLPDALSPNTEHRTPKKDKSTAPATPTPRESDALCQDFLEAVGARYAWQGAKDGVALAALRKVASLEEIRARWRRGLSEPVDKWLSVRSVAALRAKWNDLALPYPQASNVAPRASCTLCGALSIGGMGGTATVPLCVPCLEDARGSVDDTEIFTPGVLEVWVRRAKGAA